MITQMRGILSRPNSIHNAESGQVAIVLMFMVASIGNLNISLLGTSPLSAFVVGEVIIGLFLLDFLRTKILMHVYQILLIYFYFSLVVAHSFNDQSIPFYSIAYLINSLHFLFFVVGYQLITTRKAVKPVVTPRQNTLSLVCLIFGLMSTIYVLWIKSDAVSYGGNFLSYEEATNQPIYKIYANLIIGNIYMLIIFLKSHPIIISMHSLFISLVSYPMTGIKGHLLSSLFVVIVVTQIYIFRFSAKWLLVLGIVGVGFCFVLIGSTNFRGQLSIESLFNTVTDISILIDRWRYFILQSPESSHIRYTADIVRMIEENVTEFRYGFDYYRFFIYPIKSIFDDFQLASYNQYPVLLSGQKMSAGLYFGLAGELFWNFGWFFPLFSIAYGYSLKWFTNFAFSGSFFWLCVVPNIV